MKRVTHVFTATALTLMVSSSLFAETTLSKAPIGDKQATNVPPQVLMREKALSINASEKALKTDYKEVISQLSEKYNLCEEALCEIDVLADTAKATEGYASQSKSLFLKTNEFVATQLDPELKSIKKGFSDDLTDAKKSYQSIKSAELKLREFNDLKSAVASNDEKVLITKAAIDFANQKESLMVDVKSLLLKRHKVRVFDVLKEVYIDRAQKLDLEAYAAAAKVGLLEQRQAYLIEHAQLDSAGDLQGEASSYEPIELTALTTPLPEPDFTVKKVGTTGIELPDLSIASGDEMNWLAAQFEVLSKGID